MARANDSLEVICREGIPGYDPWADAQGAWFDVAAAQRAIDFFQHPEDGCLRHIEGDMAGCLFTLEPWQQAIVGNLFGWQKKDRKGRVVRRYREVFIYVPRKNGKTPLVAGIANYVLFCDGEVGAQIYCAAAEREQASLLYRHAKGMVEQEPQLQSRATIYNALRSIVFTEQGSSLKVLSADADTKHGGNSHMIMVDELHAQPNRDLVDVLQTSMASENRKQPLLIFITTADYDRESICNEKYAYACKVRDRVIDDTAFLPVVFEALRDDDWESPDVWRKANPNLGVSVSEEYLERECVRAKESPAYLNTFLRLHLNIRTQNDVAWLDMQRWDACGAVPVTPESLEGSECFAGLDLSSTTDISALSLVFGEDEGVVVLPFFWIPEDRAHQREKKDRVPYLTWAKAGHITLTPGNVIDYDHIRKQIGELGKRYNIRKIAIDRWNATQLAVQLQQDGFEVELFGQGFASMSGPTKHMEKLVVGGNLAHGGNPVLRWMASNAMAEQDAAGNIKPSKKRSTEKIDGIVATVMGLGVLIGDESNSVSIYDREGRGFVTLG